MATRVSSPLASFEQLAADCATIARTLDFLHTLSGFLARACALRAAGRRALADEIVALSACCAAARHETTVHSSWLGFGPVAELIRTAQRVQPHLRHSAMRTDVAVYAITAAVLADQTERSIDRPHESYRTTEALQHALQVDLKANAAGFVTVKECIWSIMDAEGTIAVRLDGGDRRVAERIARLPSLPVPLAAGVATRSFSLDQAMALQNGLFGRLDARSRDTLEWLVGSPTAATTGSRLAALIDVAIDVPRLAPIDVATQDSTSSSFIAARGEWARGWNRVLKKLASIVDDVDGNDDAASQTNDAVSRERIVRETPVRAHQELSTTATTGDQPDDTLHHHWRLALGLLQPLLASMLGATWTSHAAARVALDLAEAMQAPFSQKLYRQHVARVLTSQASDRDTRVSDALREFVLSEAARLLEVRRRIEANSISVDELKRTVSRTFAAMEEEFVAQAQPSRPLLGHDRRVSDTATPLVCETVDDLMASFRARGSASVGSVHRPPSVTLPDGADDTIRRAVPTPTPLVVDRDDQWPSGRGRDSEMGDDDCASLLVRLTNHGSSSNDDATDDAATTDTRELANRVKEPAQPVVSNRHLKPDARISMVQKRAFVYDCLQAQGKSKRWITEFLSTRKDEAVRSLYRRLKKKEGDGDCERRRSRGTDVSVTDEERGKGGRGLHADDDGTEDRGLL